MIVLRFNRRELKELGYTVSREGYLLDNRDGFYDDNGDDHIRTYDRRTYVAISRGLLIKLIEAID